MFAATQYCQLQPSSCGDFSDRSNCWFVPASTRDVWSSSGCQAVCDLACTDRGRHSRWPKTLSQELPAVALLNYQYLCCSFWLLKWPTSMSRTPKVHRSNSSWTSTWWTYSHTKVPMARSSGWSVRLCITVLHHWLVTCCQYQHLKHMWKEYFSSVECYRLK